MLGEPARARLATSSPARPDTPNAAMDFRRYFIGLCLAHTSRGALPVYCPLFGGLAQKVPGYGATYCLDSLRSCTCSVGAEAVKPGPRDERNRQITGENDGPREVHPTHWMEFPELPGEREATRELALPK